MILTTHYMEEATFLCDRIVILDKGKILAIGTLDELLLQHKSEEIIEFTLDGGPELPRLEDKFWFRKMNRDNNRKKVTLFVTEILVALPEILKMVEQENIRLLGLECRRMTLDDLFVSLTGRRLTDE